MPSTLRSPKSRRINLRASADQEQLLRTVAQQKGQTMTEFIVESACEVAARELADQTQFSLSPEKWRDFVDALERPAKIRPRLHRLFVEPSILEGDTSKP
jgi:uncharacterized protein (DUF1778 family)